MDVRVTFGRKTHSPFLSRYLEMRLRSSGVNERPVSVYVDIEKKEQGYHLDCSLEHQQHSLEIKEEFAVNPKHALDAVLGRMLSFCSQ